MAGPDRPPTLTPRQLEVLELMAKGLANRQIAEALGVATATAKNHVSAVIAALDVTNRTEAATALHELGLRRAGPVTREHTVAGFGARPAIAVLPFDTFSDDPGQALLADGLVGDLVARLGTWRWFPVVSHASTRVYRGRAVDAVEVSRALGARYLVEGSVRRAGRRVRIAAQLIDGPSGRHLWAQRYDRELTDVFALEAEIADTLVTTLEPALARLEGVRVLTRLPGELDVWECLHRGFVHLGQLTAAGAREAAACFGRAVALDPQMSSGYAGLAFAQVTELGHQVAADRAAAVRRVLDLSRRAIDCDPHEPLAHFTLGIGLAFSGDSEAALAANARALELNPSLAWAHCGLGIALCALSRADEGAAALETAIRLSPQDPFLPYVLVALGSARALQGRLEEAIACLERSRTLAPHLPIAHGALAACQVACGRVEEARRTLADLAARHPGFSPLQSLEGWVPAESLAPLARVLAAAGWVEPE